MATRTEPTTAMLLRAKLRATWFAGRIEYLFRGEQMWAYRAYRRPGKNAHQHILALQWARRSGKDFFCAGISTEDCIQIPRARIIYGHPVASVGKSILQDVMENFILSDCPTELRPRWRENYNRYEFPSLLHEDEEQWRYSSHITVRGLGDRREINGARGPRANLINITEAGFIPQLDYAISTLTPMLAGQPGEQMLVLQTNAADSEDHHFWQVLDAAKAHSMGQEMTVYQNSSLTDADRAVLAASVGGEHTEEWQMEYCCARTSNSKLKILPGFAKRAHECWVAEVVELPARPGQAYPEKVEVVRQPTSGESSNEPLVREVEPPRYHNMITAMDVAYKPHHTFAVAGYYHPGLDAGVVLSCRDMVEADYDEMAAILEQMEEEAFGAQLAWLKANHPREPELVTHHRWMDVDPRAQAEISKRGLRFATINNRDPKAAVRTLNTEITYGRVIIHPRCVELVAHMSIGKWNKARTKFAEHPTYGHFDGVSAASIFVNHLAKSTKVTPATPLELRGKDIVVGRDLGKQWRPDGTRRGKSFR